eukprot:TRINITY_DN91473_c0_g1_i1.p1 TRINITY_DN91473_c0_g1~~TRINITY_DN91473_c0_g1_i1.p1  ORF type:complete len:147 (+),score=19.95 TRINITY_DN91473_c0_g1_i1:30-470(+)
MFRTLALVALLLHWPELASSESSLQDEVSISKEADGEGDDLPLPANVKAALERPPRPWYKLYDNNIKNTIVIVLIILTVAGFLGDKYYTWKANRRREERLRRQKKSDARSDSHDSKPAEQRCQQVDQKALTEAVRSVLRERRPAGP